MIDLNGDFKYSQEKEVNIGNDNSNWLGLSIPNPAVNEATIEFNVAQAGNVEINLYDISGKLVQHLFSGFVNAGTTSVKINTSELSSGTYNYIMSVGDNHVSQQLKVVK